MSYEPTTKPRPQRRVSSRRSSAESFRLLLVPALLCAAQASTAEAPDVANADAVFIEIERRDIFAEAADD